MTTADRYLLDMDEEPAIEEVFISRASGQDLLRAFSASILLDDSMTTETVIGAIRGLVGWRILDDDSLWAAADAISADAEILGGAADQIRGRLLSTGDDIDTVVMIELLRLDPQFRGQRLTAKIINELVEVLALVPESTLVVCQPEPQKEDGGPLPDGPERADALRRLRRAYEASGFRRWRRSQVWWRLGSQE